MRYGPSFGFGRARRRGGPAPAIVSQSFGVQIAARAYSPIVVAQSWEVEIAAGEGAGSYSPLDEPSPVAWFDMLDPAAFSEVAGVITSVTNKVSSVAWNTGTLPTYSATGLNSKPAMVFNGSTQAILSSEAAVVAALTDAAPLTVYAVVHATSDDATSGFFGSGNTGTTTSNSKRFGTSTNGNGRWRYTTVNSAAGGVNSDAGSDIVAAPHILAFFTDDGIHCNLEEDDILVINNTSHNPGDNNPNRCAIGCRPAATPDGFFTGAIGELLVFGASHDAGARQRIYDYLAAAWEL